MIGSTKRWRLSEGFNGRISRVVGADRLQGSVSNFYTKTSGLSL